MAAKSFVVLECAAPECALRFPLVSGERRPARCPLCGGPLVEAASGLTGSDTQQNETEPRPPALPIELLVDNVRSAFNAGSILRSAEAAGLRHVWLCGITPTPEHPRVLRAALGAEADVGWSHHRNALHLARRRLDEGAIFWALEAEADAVPLNRVTLPTLQQAPDGLILVAGNEVTGIDPALRALCEQAVCLPMRGRKRSLNVAVAVGAALHWLAFASELAPPRAAPD